MLRGWRQAVLASVMQSRYKASMANDIKSIDIGVHVQLVDGNPCATWSFGNEKDGRDATQVRLFSGEEYRVTYRLLDASSWSLDAISLRRVFDSTSAGFVTLTRGETTQPQTLADGAGTVAVVGFDPEAVTLDVTNALTSSSEPFTLGLSLTVSARSAQGTPKQSSQDPQMVLEPITIPPPPMR